MLLFCCLFAVVLIAVVFVQVVVVAVVVVDAVAFTLICVAFSKIVVVVVVGGCLEVKFERRQSPVRRMMVSIKSIKSIKRERAKLCTAKQ